LTNSSFRVSTGEGMTKTRPEDIWHRTTTAAARTAGPTVSLDSLILGVDDERLDRAMATLEALMRSVHEE
jgi:hypothetical protein